MLCLGKLNGLILNFSPGALEPCDSCFENQNKIGFSKNILCSIESKRLDLELLCFPGYVQMVLKDLFLVIFICENFLLFLCKTFILCRLWPEWLRLKGNNFLNCLCKVSSRLNSVFGSIVLYKCLAPRLLAGKNLGWPGRKLVQNPRGRWGNVPAWN